MKFATTTTAAARPARPAMPTFWEDTVPLALDRASVRRTDQDGHLFVEVANLSAAGVSSYQAEEIPGWQALGFRPGQAVPLLRPPEELAKAAPTLCGKPVLAYHRPVSSLSHPHKIVVGAVGGDVRFEGGWLRGSLTLWDAEAISLVEDGSARALSCGYAYVPTLESGSYQGERFAGKMTALRFNHLAICSEGRVPGCFVADAAPNLKGKFMPARPPGLARDDETELDDGIKSQLLSYLGELLTSEQMADIETILSGGTVGSPAMAGDAKAIARRVVADQRARQERAYLERFPEARRLRG